MVDWKSSLLVVLGGGAGAWLRFALGRWCEAMPGVRSFPWITFGINVAGSFLLGVIAAVFVQRPSWRLLLGTGFCGGFTTFSTFSFEALELLKAERYAAAVAYATGSVAAGLVGAYLGTRIVR